MNPRRLLAVALAAAVGFLGDNLANAGTVSINPSRDNTLYEYDPDIGDVSNALGRHFFAGKTAMNALRRGVLAFDIANNIPPFAVITAASLSVNMSRTPTNDGYVMELHKLLADWGEGTSIAPGQEGTGAPATPLDATWRHRFFDTIFWTTQGGDFSATVSASQMVGGIGHYTWSSAQMVADVQGWLDHPDTNFGWLILAGDESLFLTAKRFDTRESTNPPVLAITYVGGTPTPTATASPTPTATSTSTPTATATATSTATATPTATAVVTPSVTPTATSTATATSPTSTPTATSTVTATATPSGTPIATPTPSATPRATPTPRSRPTPRQRPTPPVHITPLPPPSSPRPTPHPRPTPPVHITPLPPPSSPRPTPPPRP